MSMKKFIAATLVIGMISFSLPADAGHNGFPIDSRNFILGGGAPVFSQGGGVHSCGSFVLHGFYDGIDLGGACGLWIGWWTGSDVAISVYVYEPIFFSTMTFWYRCVNMQGAPLTGVLGDWVIGQIAPGWRIFNQDYKFTRPSGCDYITIVLDGLSGGHTPITGIIQVRDWTYDM